MLALLSLVALTVFGSTNSSSSSPYLTSSTTTTAPALATTSTTVDSLTLNTLSVPKTTVVVPLDEEIVRVMRYQPDNLKLAQEKAQSLSALIAEDADSAYEVSKSFFLYQFHLIKPALLIQSHHSPFCFFIEKLSQFDPKKIKFLSG